MKIIREDLDNLERVKDRKTTQGIMMKDAEQQSSKSEENFKEVAGTPEELKEKKPFLGAEKQETPKEIEVPKSELEESLFENTSLNEDVNVNDVYAIVEGALDNALDNIANIIASRISDYNIEWCVDEPSQETTILQAEYIESVVNDLFKNRNYNESFLNEAGGIKNGVLVSTEGEPFTFWDKIYAELDGNLHPQENDYKKLSELPMKNRKDKYQEISVDNDGNIRVFASTRDRLKHAINVAEYYDLDYKAGTSLGYNDPEKAFYCTIYIPEYIQDKYVTYDARNKRYRDEDEKEEPKEKQVI